MTYPPNDGSFPGPPGGQPFPGQPGQPHPGSQPHPGLPGQPRPGPQAPGGFPGQPGQPPGGRQPFPPDHSHAPPAQPGYGAPGGTPPQRPPVPGHPAQPGPPRRPRRGLLIGGAAAAVLLAVSLGVVVWNIADDRPYAELPSCGRLLPAEVVDTVPGTDSPRAEGEFTSVEDDETGHLAEGGMLGYLSCSVGNVEAYPVHVIVSLFEYEDGGEVVEELHGELEDELRDREEGHHEEERDEGTAVLDWRPVSAGDNGYAVLFESDGYTDGSAYGAVFFATVNVTVSVSYTVGDDGVGEAEALGFLADFAGRVERQLSRESERA
ncbi:hypothetical protein [Nocardiopsis deserti]|uniref:hypothetical protein n=1 Tax=Nocardiopsis deserti TaxID=2605988 RepID=UPI001238C937|nr:hypothetical protein [Nocardiopsis deserti]